MTTNDSNASHTLHMRQPTDCHPIFDPSYMKLKNKYHTIQRKYCSSPSDSPDAAVVSARQRHVWQSALETAALSNHRRKTVVDTMFEASRTYGDYAKSSFHQPHTTHSYKLTDSVGSLASRKQPSSMSFSQRKEVPLTHKQVSGKHSARVCGRRHHPPVHLPNLTTAGVMTEQKTDCYVKLNDDYDNGRQRGSHDLELTPPAAVKEMASSSSQGSSVLGVSAIPDWQPLGMDVLCEYNCSIINTRSLPRRELPCEASPVKLWRRPQL